VVVGAATPAAGVACLGAQDTDGHEGVPVGLIVGIVNLVNGGDDLAVSRELHTLASLYFVSSK
jgi:hypothetical protein